MPDLSVLTKNWLLKLLSLIIGASRWYFVVGEDRVDLIVTIPLELRNLPTDLVIANQYKKDIEVALTGPRRLIQDMRQQDISLPIDLSAAQPGAMVIQNEADAIPLPQGISVQRVQPATLTLLVDRLVQKDFPITPMTKGKPAAGYTLESLNLKPPHITVTGPLTVLEKEQNLTTSLINLDGLATSTTMQVHLDLNEALVKLIGETVIEAKVSVKETMVRKTIRGVMIKRPSGEEIRFTPNMVTVEAEIPTLVAEETPELSLLLRAALVLPLDATGSEASVQVNGIQVPGHAPLIIHSVVPEKVKLLK